jgi:hypothetical protein
MMRVWLTTVCLLALTNQFAMGDDMRTMQYTPRSPDDASQWQGNVREALFDRLRLTDLVKSRRNIPLDPQIVKREERDGLVLEHIRIHSTRERTINAVLARPLEAEGALPAVVCIHGHGGDRFTPFNPEARQYKLFGTELVRRGFVVICTDVGQHEVYEKGRTLMGERLWDLIRCVDYLESMAEVDPNRIGCAGLSLGGEMAMWLAAMDERVAATVSAGFLTVMDQMEQNHCMCWKFDGLRELVDFADIYSLIAPRPLQCQNGLKERPTQFIVPLAEKAMKDIGLIYRDLGCLDNARLEVHDGGHEIALEPLIDFLSTHLAGRQRAVR